MTRASVSGPGLLVAALASCALVVVASLMTFDETRAQTSGSSRASSAQLRLRVSRDGRSVALVERGRAYTLSLGDKVGAARIEEAKLLLVTRRGEFTYLLFDVCGLSKRRPDDRMCGAGQECNVVWVKLDGRRKVADARSELYESCWLPITSEGGPEIKGRSLLLTVDDLREWVRKEVGYDAERPEEGLTLKSSAMPGQRPE